MSKDRLRALYHGFEFNLRRQKVKVGFSSNSLLADEVNKTYELLRKIFSTPFRNTYLGGKTAFRDFFYEKLGCSLMEGEAVVDMLERTARIEFKRDSQGGGYGTWEIH